MNRRTFLQASAAAAAASTVLPKVTHDAEAQAEEHVAWPENGTLIPDDGWRLWVDENAEWKNDALFLPEDVTQDVEGVVGWGQGAAGECADGGWGVLRREAAGSIAVTLPVRWSSTSGEVWRGDGWQAAEYTPEEYRYAADDPVPQNGAYFGVSWWWREIQIPAAMQGKRIFLHVAGRGCGRRCYLNEQLVGYSIMEELPFECDLTHAAKPGGKNVLAIRITNPFGRFDWVDGAECAVGSGEALSQPWLRRA